MKRKCSDTTDNLWQSDNSNRLNSRWNGDELQLGVLGVRKYGKDFQAIAELLGTKTEGQVRSFFLNYRRKYNLDRIVQEFERNNNAKQDDDDDEMEDQKSSLIIANNIGSSSSKQSDEDVMEVSVLSMTMTIFCSF